MFLKQIHKGDTSVSAYIPTIVLIAIVFLSAQVLLGIAIVGVAAMHGGVDQEAIRSLDFEAMGISKNLGFFLLLLSFVPAFFGLLFARGFHKRPFLTFITARPKLDFKRIGFAILVWGGILFVSTFLDYLFDPDNYSLTFELTSFIPLFFIALLLFPFQIAYEEILFRGYLYQLFGNIFKYPLISWVITSVLFGLMHASNPEVSEYGFWVMMPSYILLGLFLGIITILDDGLELALGVHFINNFFLGVGVNYAGSAIKVNSAFHVMTIDPASSWYGILISGSVFTFIAWKTFKFSGFSKLTTPLQKSPLD